LLSCLLTSHSFSAHLALDCLAYIARYSPSQEEGHLMVLLLVCRLGGETIASAYCEMIMDVLEPLSVPPCSHGYPVLLLGSLLNRCLAHLPSSAQLALLSLCGYSHWIWSHLQHGCLHPDTLQALALQLTPGATSTLVQRLSVEEVVSGTRCVCEAVWS
jgi:hypothetical protein